MLIFYEHSVNKLVFLSCILVQNFNKLIYQTFINTFAYCVGNIRLPAEPHFSLYEELIVPNYINSTRNYSTYWN